MLKLKSFATLNLSPQRLINLCVQAKQIVPPKVTPKMMRESYGI